MTASTLIQKHLAEKGLASRREGERLVREGKVLVNGARASNGQMINPAHDVVTIDATHASSKMTIAAHKPRGIVCSRNPLEGTTIFELFPQFNHLHVVGRLDKESEGLLLLSNDGLLTRLVTGADHTVEKEYVVTVRENVFAGMMEKMSKGIVIDGKKTLPCSASLTSRHSFTIILKEGRKHQIRRMCEACKLTVESLQRVRIGNVPLGSLKPSTFTTVTVKVF
jgi:23S rRNA pseudouridine2604 synthase